MRDNPRILFTTAYLRSKKDLSDIGGNYPEIRFRWSSLRKISLGLRFLHQNIPEIEILEYPTWQEYTQKLKQGWDVVGFSFYINEIPEILRMVENAREERIPELWAGNYGVLTDGIEKYFDKIFIGYAEEQVAQILNKKIDRLRHPPLITILRLGPFFIKYRLVGVLFTSRGCPYRCKFCQTPLCAPKPKKIPLESIEEVLQCYKSLHCQEVFIADDNWGTFPEHSDKVFELLAKYGLKATVMARADIPPQSLDNWIKNGLTGFFTGIESLSQLSLNKIDKREEVYPVRETIEYIARRNCYTTCFNMIGFESDTEEWLREETELLSEYPIDYFRFSVVTPLPKTPLWYEIEEKYGIFEKDYHLYDNEHLVWNHPYLTKESVERIWKFKLQRLDTPSRYLKGIYKLIHRYQKDKGFLDAWRYLLSAPLHAFFFDEGKELWLPK